MGGKPWSIMAGLFCVVGEFSVSATAQQSKGVKVKRLAAILTLSVAMLGMGAAPAYAMHIAEGILPLPWAGAWYLVALPFVVYGVREMRRKSLEMPAYLPLIGMVAAAVFIISAMPIPVPSAGTCSHPAGTGLAAIIIGPFATVVATSVALLIQALFLAHGGITTWGADILSMGVAGAFSGFLVFKLLVRLKAPLTVAAFFAGVISDWATYTTTALELALGLGGAQGFASMFKAILIAFIPTQLPIGILEGFAAAGFFAFMLSRRPDILIKLGIIERAPQTGKGVSYEQAV